MYIHLIAVKIRLSIHKTLAYNTVISYRTAGCKKKTKMLWMFCGVINRVAGSQKHRHHCGNFIHETNTEDFVCGTIPLFSQWAHCRTTTRRKNIYKIYWINAHIWQTIVPMSLIKVLKCSVWCLCQRAVYALYHKQSTSLFHICI